jgi:hypothetical protein
MKVSTENDNNFGYEKITILVDNIPLRKLLNNRRKTSSKIKKKNKKKHKYNNLANKTLHCISSKKNAFLVQKSPKTIVIRIIFLDDNI